MKSFNVIIYDRNKRKFIPYDIIPYLKKCYDKEENKPVTLEEFKNFITKHSMYQWWARCEYEIILSDWPPSGYEEKWDVHKQVIMNIDIIVNILYGIFNK